MSELVIKKEGLYTVVGGRYCIPNMKTAGTEHEITLAGNHNHTAPITMTVIDTRSIVKKGKKDPITTTTVVGKFVDKWGCSHTIRLTMSSRSSSCYAVVDAD